MAKTQPEQTSNPAFTGSGVAGVPANHSSTELPTYHSEEADHSQWDDAEDNISPSLDPNISGTGPTEQMHSECAGELNGWCDNDDYRTFLQEGRAPESALVRTQVPSSGQANRWIHDGDYDDNHGLPSPVPAYNHGYDHASDAVDEDHMEAEPRRGAAYDTEEYVGFPINVVTRRI